MALSPSRTSVSSVSFAASCAGLAAGGAGAAGLAGPDGFFAPALEKVESVLGWLRGGAAEEMDHAGLEERLLADGHEFARLMLQGYGDGQRRGPGRLGRDLGDQPGAAAARAPQLTDDAGRRPRTGHGRGQHARSRRAGGGGSR